MIVPVALLAGMARARRMAGGKEASVAAAMPVVAAPRRKLRREVMRGSGRGSGRAAHFGFGGGVRRHGRGGRAGGAGRGRGAAGDRRDRTVAAAAAAGTQREDGREAEQNRAPTRPGFGTGGSETRMHGISFFRERMSGGRSSRARRVRLVADEATFAFALISTN